MSNPIAHRTVYACQKAAKRRFSSNNYKGKWSHDDEIKLVELVKVMGNQWSKIAQELDRTPENCRDKFREVGGFNYDKRRKGKWDLEEKIELIRIVNMYSEEKFYKREAILEYKDKDSVMYQKDISDKSQKCIDKGFRKRKKTVSLYHEFELADIADLLVTDPEDVPSKNIPWAEVSKEMVSFNSILLVKIPLYVSKITVSLYRKNLRKLVNPQGASEAMMTARMNGRPTFTLF